MIPVKHIYIAVAIVCMVLLGVMAGAFYFMVGAQARQEQFKADMKNELSRVAADFNAKLDEIKGARKEAGQSPEAATAVINRYLELKQPAIYVKPADPAAPSYLSIPSASVQPMAQAVLDCAECKARLNKCDTELGLQTRRAELAEQSLKGGSFFQRLKSNSRWLVIGGAIGAGVAYGTKH